MYDRPVELGQTTTTTTTRTTTTKAGVTRSDSRVDWRRCTDEWPPTGRYVDHDAVRVTVSRLFARARVATRLAITDLLVNFSALSSEHQSVGLAQYGARQRPTVVLKSLSGNPLDRSRRYGDRSIEPKIRC